MQFFKTITLLLSFSIAVLPVLGDTPKKVQSQVLGLTLADNDTSRYVIALATDAIPSEKTAAQELSQYLYQVTGAKFSVKDEGQVADNTPKIFIGAGQHVKKLLPGFKWEALGQDGIVIKTIGRDLILAGGRPRGTLYATYHFLENAVGVRWWAPDATTVPKKKTLRVTTQNTIYTPKLRTREAFFNSLIADPLFAARLKMNGNSQHQGPELGGHNSILGWCHTMEQLLPITQYFPEHPEWFSDPLNGGKPCTSASSMPTRWQPCLTNEALRLELTKNALAWIRKNPEAGMISISQNDNYERCTAPADLAIEEREGSPSGPLLQFVNAVAADIEKEYPDFLVETLAYQYTQKPPRFTRPRRNVVIRLCSIDADFSRPLNSDANKDFRDDVLAWKAIAPRLYIWDYSTNFSNVIFPHPNMQVLGSNIRFFTANNAIGLFSQSDAYSNGTGDMIAMRTWLISHLMWEPSLDQKKLENEFLTGYYGAAAPHLRAYIDGIQKAFLRSGEKLTLAPIEYPYLRLEVMNEATRQFHRAESAVSGNAVLTSRLRRDRLALDHAWILRYKTLHAEAQRSGQAFEGPSDIVAFTVNFVKTAREFKAQNSSEGGSFETYAEELLANAMPAPLPNELKGKSEDEVVDIQEAGLRPLQQVVVVDDQASNGRSIKMPGSSSDWIVQYIFGQYLTSDTRRFIKADTWHCYASIRVQAKEGAKPGPAVSYGIYNEKTRDYVTRSEKALEEIGDGQYHLVDLGTHTLGPGMYFFAAPPGREDIDSVYIDRLLFVREPATP